MHCHPQKGGSRSHLNNTTQYEGCSGGGLNNDDEVSRCQLLPGNMHCLRIKATNKPVYICVCLCIYVKLQLVNIQTIWPTTACLCRPVWIPHSLMCPCVKQSNSIILSLKAWYQVISTLIQLLYFKSRRTHATLYIVENYTSICNSDRDTETHIFSFTHINCSKLLWITIKDHILWPRTMYVCASVFIEIHACLSTCHSNGANCLSVCTYLYVCIMYNFVLGCYGSCMLLYFCQHLFIFMSVCVCIWVNKFHKQLKEESGSRLQLKGPDLGGD